jgi:hypothetical protein
MAHKIIAVIKLRFWQWYYRKPKSMLIEDWELREKRLYPNRIKSISKEIWEELFK